MRASAEHPDHIGRYRVERVLGRGAMGVVFQAHDPVIDRKVAIKLVRAELLDEVAHAEYLARFQREAQAAGRCQHANIVAIYDFALHNANPFLVMEYIDGMNLADVLRQRGRFAVDAALGVIRQVLDALACAHAIGVVHRDVKPANILLTASDRVKMTDFGIARLDTSHLTQDGSMIGTPSYMSPEQCVGDPVDARTDLFSAGAVLYEMLCGGRAFLGHSATEVTFRVVHEAPADLRTLVPDIPLGVEAVVRRALAKAPANRFASAQEMSAAVRDCAMPAMAPLGDTVVAPVSRTIISPLEIERAERALAVHLGPIAKVLVKRTLANAATAAALWENLAVHIEHEADRAAFLRQLGRRR
jgi:eukaryotic-like serine/threonine-protein kinase